MPNSLWADTLIKQTHSSVETAELIGRSPATLSMKMCNFARFDPKLQRRGVSGLSNGSRLDEEIWMEFYSDFSLLAYEATVILSKFKNQGVESFVDLTDVTDIPLGDTRNQIVRVRINQSFFEEHYSLRLITLVV